MSEPRQDRPQPATLNLFPLADHVRRLKAEAPIAAHGRDSLTLVRDPEVDVVVVALAAGGRLPQHRAPGPVSVLVLEGRIAFTAGGRRLEAGPHDLITLEARAPHSVEALEPSAMLITISTPRGA